MSLYILVGTIHSLERGAYAFGPKENSVKGKEEAGMFSFSQRDMMKMVQVRKHLSLFDRTPPARVVKGLCDRDTYFCSPRFDAILNRSPCSSWEQHHVVSPVAQAPAWTLPERVVIRPYGSGNCGCRRNPPGRVVSCPWISDFCGRRSSAMLRRTPPERVVVSLCVYKNGASRAIYESVADISLQLCAVSLTENLWA